jgi:hypothetical protein
MEVLTLAVFAIANIFCFVIGAKVGQAVSKGEKVEMPNINPMEAIREHQAKKEAERKQDIMDVVMSNIDAYDGTSNGQRDVPKG